MAPKASKGSKSQQPKAPESVIEYPTIQALLDAKYNASRPYHELVATKGLQNLTALQKTHYAYARFFETGVWKTWNQGQQKEFWKYIESSKIPIPQLKAKELGRDKSGRDIGSYTPKEYEGVKKRERDLGFLRWKSQRFRDLRGQGLRVSLKSSKGEEGKEKEEKSEEGEIEKETNRRKLIGVLQGKKMGIYEGNPEWDDVVPIPQDDGEGALAQIAYTDEYAEAMSYLRAVMATSERTPRVLALTSHIISLNPAHYTVWLYRASTLFALKSSIRDELDWVNDIALENQKNYQIWHHRQLLIDELFKEIGDSPRRIKELETEEREFMDEMFEMDAKNYHVWSYRQYLVRKLNLFNEAELKSVETLLRKDIRNNSAWSHRFFIVFSDPKHSSPDSPATSHDPQIPDSILDREIEFAKAATFEAPQNQSPWNYLRGVLQKGGRKLSTLECFAREFVKDGEGEDVKSSHALDFLADVWIEKGEVEKARWALRLLGDKYDRIRKGYWEWKLGQIEQGVEGRVQEIVGKVDALKV